MNSTNAPDGAGARPCPFCGADARIEEVARLRPFDGPVRQVVRCTNCKAQSREKWSADELLTLWNRREEAAALTDQMNEWLASDDNLAAQALEVSRDLIARGNEIADAMVASARKERDEALEQLAARDAEIGRATALLDEARCHLTHGYHNGIAERIGEYLVRIA
jgi:hypothetical protein